MLLFQCFSRAKKKKMIIFRCFSRAKTRKCLFPNALHERKREKCLKPMCFLVFATLRNVFWKSQDAQKERQNSRKVNFWIWKQSFYKRDFSTIFLIFLESFLRSSQKLPGGQNGLKPTPLRTERRKRLEIHMLYERKRGKRLKPSFLRESLKIYRKSIKIYRKSMKI